MSETHGGPQLRIRHPFEVRDVQRRLAFAGTPHERDSGDKQITLWSLGDAVKRDPVGLLTITIGAKDAHHFPVGRIVSLELVSPARQPVFDYEATT